MDIFTFAMDKEDAAEKHYRALSDQATSPGLKHIFTYLADMEHRHYQVVAGMRDQARVELEDESLDKAEWMFNRISEDKDAVLGEQQRQVDAYKAARQLEKESLEFYQEQADKAVNEENRKIFRKLAEQEKMHYIFMDNFVEFVMQPEVWHEDAEFSHIIEKYRGTAYYPGMMDYDI